MGSTDFVAIVLAAGQGTRMKSDLPKVLHPVCGRPMISWAVETAREAGAGQVVVVVGHGRQGVMTTLAERFESGVSTAVQEEQRGTGHAVECALPSLEGHQGRVLILYGDCPLVPEDALRALDRAAVDGGGPLAMLTARLEDPTGYGRIIRDDQGRIVAIREHRDCSTDELALQEVNPGMYAVDAAFLRDAIADLSSDNAQGELYLTDVVRKAARSGGVTDVPWPMHDLVGINDRWDLAQAERAMQDRINRAHAVSGVTLRDAGSTYIDADTTIAPGTTIEPGVHLRGGCVVEEDVRLDTGCVLDNVRVARGVWLKPYTVATDSQVGENAQAGPFSHLRPASDLGPDSRVGNFVETKKTRLGRGSKANHLAYLGDGEIGEGVNVGAGTIFCNYDGFQKHTTVLEDGCFIGSDSQIVAPVRVGQGAYVATGTTVTRDVPDDALAISRPKQLNKDGYASRLRARMKMAKAAKAAKG